MDLFKLYIYTNDLIKSNICNNLPQLVTLNPVHGVSCDIFITAKN